MKLIRKLKSLFTRQEKPVRSYAEFWKWFQNQEGAFHKAIKSGKDVDKDFLEPLFAKLKELRSGIYLLAGTLDSGKVEVVFTAEGNFRNIYFVEELVAAAPALDRWKFTASKPPTAICNFSLGMSGYTFDKDHLSFYPEEHAGYPDEIKIVVIHKDLDEHNNRDITLGVYNYLDNYLGELNSITIIDSLDVKGPDEAEQDLIPIEKLEGYLNWRQKEFVEKYDAVRHVEKDDRYASLNGELEDGRPLVMIVNSTLLDWDGKASHPWITDFTMEYDGEDTNGMPDQDLYQLMDTIEDEIAGLLPDFKGYLNIGRQTGGNRRKVYTACKDFRDACKVFDNIQDKYGENISMNLTVFKDKYWRSFDKFRV
jgi:hypothetical protein